MQVCKYPQIFNSLIWSWRKGDESRRLTLDYIEQHGSLPLIASFLVLIRIMQETKRD